MRGILFRAPNPRSSALGLTYAYSSKNKGFSIKHMKLWLSASKGSFVRMFSIDMSNRDTIEVFERISAAIP